jgi:hypothetical protein
MNESDSSKADRTLHKRVRIKYNYPDDLKSQFIQQVIINHEPEHFVISFFEVWTPPILADTENEKRKIFESLESVEAKCVSRVVVTPSKMKQMVKAMVENLDQYEEKFGKLKGQEPGRETGVEHE